MYYRAHGLAISSDRSIPELIECATPAATDVVIRFGELPVGHDRDGGTPWFESQHRTASGEPALVATRRGAGRWLEFAYPDGTSFLLEADGTAIWANWPPTMPFAGMCEYLVGPILGIVLRLRGVVCLHASAVVIGERAVAFAGPAGAGKSTLAATFARAGFRVLSDDTITITERNSIWSVAPAYPRIRLWPDAVSALGLDAAAVVAPEGGDADTRHQVDLASNGLFANEPVPLAAIYLIEFAEGLTRAGIEPLMPAAVLAVLAANTFANRVLDRDRRAREFEALADLVTALPVRRLERAPSLAALDHVRDAVLADQGRIAR